MVGLVGAALNSVVRGPATTAANVTRYTSAENHMIMASRLAVAGAATQANSGDCDDDDFVEPLPYRDPSGAQHPNGGGLLPSSIGASLTDPWGSQYGYCAFDHGPKSVSDAVPACGTPPRRLQGSPNDDQPVIAVISAGKNRLFETSCNAYQDVAPANGEPDTKLVLKPSTSDDIVQIFTYAEASKTSDGLWTLKDSEPTTAQIGKDIEVQGAADIQGPLSLWNGGNFELWFDNTGDTAEGVDTSLRFAPNDGTGNIQRYINSTGGASPTFQSNGYGLREAFNPSDYRYSIYGAGVGLKGAAQTWKNFLTYDLLNWRMGLGTASPGDALVVTSPTVADVKIEASANGDNYAGLRLRNSQSSWLWQTTPSSSSPSGRLRLVRENNGVEAISVKTTGEVGLGISDPTARLDVGGDIRTTGTITINNASPSLYLQDTNERSAVLHVNSNHFHVLTTNGANSTTLAMNGTQWPFIINLTNDDMAFGGNIHMSEGNINLGGGALLSNVGPLRDANGGWVRTYGATGWYSQTFGGGWYMADGTWIQTYGGKPVLFNNAFATAGGATVGCGAALSGYQLQVCNGTARFDSNVEANGNIYWGTGGNWLSGFLNQGVRNDNAPTFAGLYLRAQNASEGGELYFNGGSGGYSPWIIDVWNSSIRIWPTSIGGTGNVNLYNPNGNTDLYVYGKAHAYSHPTWSDRDLKTDIKPMASELESIAQLEPVTFRWKDNTRNGRHPMLGLIAQDVEKIFPQAVSKAKSAMDEKEYYTVDYAALTAPMIQGIKELKDITDALGAENAAVRAALESRGVGVEAASPPVEVSMTANAPLGVPWLVWVLLALNAALTTILIFRRPVAR